MSMMQGNSDAEETETQKGKSEPDQVRFWLGLIGEAKEDARPWVNECRAAWREYQAETTDGAYRQRQRFDCRTFPLYWSDTSVMLAALWGGSPKPVVSRRFDRDPVARTASIALERYASYMKAESQYDRTMKDAALEFMHTNRVTARVWYQAQTVKRRRRYPVYPEESVDEMEQPTTIYVDDSGDLAPEDVEILTDDAGGYYYEGGEDDLEEVTDGKVISKALHFDELLHTAGARTEGDLWWKAFQVKTTRKAARERFGAIVDQIKVSKGADAEDEGDDESKMFSFWEIWDKKDRKVYWLHEQLKGQFLPDPEGGADPYELTGFYPCPKFVTATERQDNCYPVPDYTQCGDLYENLHLLASRINAVTASIKGVSLFDSSHPELLQLMNRISDGMAIGIPDLQKLVEKGGLDALILFPPYERLAQTLQILLQAFEQTKGQIYELRGISDIIRGASDPATSASAEKIKRAAANRRFDLRRHAFDGLGRDLLEMICDLGLKVQDDETIAQICGVAYMDPEDQQRWPQALVMMRDDKSRHIRLELETDQTIALREQDEEEQASKLLNATANYLKPMIESLATQPTTAPLVFKVLEMALSKFRNGKHAEDELAQTFQQVMQALQPQEPPPPPPDYKGQELQIRQFEAQVKAMEAQTKAMEAQSRAALNQTEARVRELEATLKQIDAQLKQRDQLFTEQTTVEKLNMDYQTTQAELREKMVEEQRLLQQNVMLPQERAAAEASEGGQEAPQAPAVVINMHQPQAAPQPVVVPDFGGVVPITPEDILL